MKNQTLLDREVRSFYTATLQATDTDGKSGTTFLEISLTDVNDNPPVISRETYLEFVSEGEPFQLTIQVNSQTTYLHFWTFTAQKKIHGKRRNFEIIVKLEKM